MHSGRYLFSKISLLFDDCNVFYSGYAMKYFLTLLLISCLMYHFECLPTIGPISRSWGYNLGTSAGPGWGGGIGGIYPGLSVYSGYPSYAGGYGSVFSQSPSFPGYVPGLYGQGYLGVRG